MASKTVDEYARARPDEQRKIIAALRKVVKAAAPEATESIKWAQPVYEDHGPFAFIKAASQHVTLGFWRGFEIDNGRGLLESSGSRMAHVKIRSLMDINENQLQRLVKDAVRLNRLKGDPTKGA